MKRKYIALLTIVLVILLDQCLKIWVKTNMIERTGFSVLGSWFHMFFIENEGMAFGMKFGGSIGKFLLTFFRLIFSSFIVYILAKLIREKASKGLILCTSMILAGAIGNIIDSLFYGILFTDSIGQVAKFLPEKGYAPLMHGFVVDMLYFPLIEGTFPSWVPFWGGEDFVFFRPIFNIADASITTGIISIFIFQNSFFAENKFTSPEEAIETENNPEELNN